MVSVGVYAPLHIDNVTGCIGCDGLGAPVVRWLVVVDTNAGIITTGATPSDRGNFEVRPGFDRLKDGALRTCIYAGLGWTISKQFTLGTFGKSCWGWYSTHIEPKASTTIGNSEVAMPVDRRSQAEGA